MLNGPGRCCWETHGEEDGRGACSDGGGVGRSQGKFLGIGAI